MPSPAERLLAAADLLDKRASEATQGTWEAQLLSERWEGDRPAYWVKYEHADDDGGSTSGTIAECPWGVGDARYIATMHPEVGKLLARVLRSYAEGVRDLEGILPLGAAPESDLLALADLVLAGEQEKVEG